MGEAIVLDPELFSPRSIAILGASGERGKLAHRPLEYLRRLGYSGVVYPINRNRVEIEGWRCRADLGDVDGPIDVALISLAAPMVPDALRACAERGVKLAVVLSSGVEMSPQPDPSAGSGQAPLPQGEGIPSLLVMGPNSMGFLNTRKRVAASWSSSLDLPALRSGRVGLISQSGGLGGSVMNRLQDRGVGTSHVFWSGNELRLDACHLLEFLLNDDETAVVALLIEGFRRPRRFLELAELALKRRTPLVALKLAQTPASRPLAIAHTGILAGAAAGYRAAFRQYGVVEVDSLDELVDTAALFARTPLPPGAGLGVVSSSGGASVMVTDLCHKLGLRLPDLAPRTRDELAAMLPAYAPRPTNPLDITAGLSEKALFGPLEKLANDPGVDVVLNVVTMIGGADRLRERAEGLIDATSRVSKPIVSCWTAGSLADDGLALLAEADLPFYTAPEACLRGLKALFDYGQRLDRRAVARRPPDLGAGQRNVGGRLLDEQAKGTRVLGEREAAPLLETYGLPLVTSRFAENPDEAVAAAESIGYPVVAKADVRGLAHKSGVGGVRLGLGGASAVVDAFRAIDEKIRAVGRAADLRGVLIQPQAPSGMEAVLGIAHDEHFGPQVLLGLGGQYAETLDQAAVRLAPLRESDAEELIEETPLRAAPSRSALVEAIVRLGWFAADFADLVSECDLNPVRIYSDGLLALDALIVLRKP
jgi:acetate---CoA ligase (ADP-forming)